MEREKPTRIERKISQIQPITSVDQDGLDGSRSKLFVDACSLAQQGQYEKAKTIFLRVDINCQEYGRAQYLLGCVYNKLDEYDEYKNAILAFDRAIQNFKTNEQIIPLNLFYQQGVAHWKIGAYEDAIKIFSKFIRKIGEENAHNGYLSRALVYCSMGQYKKALSDLNKANEHEEHQTAYSLCCRGRIFAHLGEYENAEQDFQAALRIKTQDFESYLQLGIVYSELGKYSRALEEFDHALESTFNSERNRAEIYFRQALVYYSLKNFDAATKKLLDAISSNPKHARAYFRLGHAYLAADKYSEALKALNTAHTLAPHDQDIIYELGVLHERVDRSKLALHEKRRAFGFRQLEPSRLKTPDSEKSISLITRTPRPPPSPSLQIVQRRPMNTHLLSAIEKEESLPVTENRLALYYKILDEYQLAIDSGECPEARVFMALCQEAEKDFVAAMDFIEKFFDELQSEPKALPLWLDCLEQLKKEYDPRKGGGLLVRRYVVMKCIENTRTDIEKDHKTFENDPSQNRKIFYDTLRIRIGQSLVAFSVTGCDVSIVSHNLKGSLSKVAWIIKYMGKASLFVPTFGSVLRPILENGSDFLFSKDYTLIQEKLSLISGMGNHAEFLSVARQVAREITDRYKDQLLLLAPDHIELSRAPTAVTIARESMLDRKDTNMPAERVANFAIKYVIETIRDQDLLELGFSSKPKTTMNDLANILIRIISSAKPNLPRRFFKCTKVDVNRRLAIQQQASAGETQENHWILYEFFRAPGIKIDNESKYDQAPWMNSTLYGYRIGTQEEIDIIQKEIEDIRTKKCCC